MCILFFAIKQHPKYPLIICANRDEFHQRPTQAMHWWSDKNAQSRILAGKDLQAGGTWLGLNKQGRFSALTNFRQPKFFDHNKKSRGDLVISSLAKKDNEMTELLAKSAHHYNGFNLVFGKLSNLICFDSVSRKQKALASGFHSLCNGALDDVWPKMALGQEQLAKFINSSVKNALDVDELFSLMQNNQQAAIEDLPSTGVPLNWEQRLSSIFITSPEYGTRTTNIVTYDNDGNISVHDQSYNEQGHCINKQCFLIK